VEVRTGSRIGVFAELESASRATWKPAREISAIGEVARSERFYRRIDLVGKGE